MEDGLNGLIVEVARDEALEEIEFIHVVGVGGALQIEGTWGRKDWRGGEVIDDEEVRVACAIELVDEIRADEAGTAGDDDHVVSLPAV